MIIKIYANNYKDELKYVIKFPEDPYYRMLGHQKIDSIRDIYDVLNDDMEESDDPNIEDLNKYCDSLHKLISLSGNAEYITGELKVSYDTLDFESYAILTNQELVELNGASLEIMVNVISSRTGVKKNKVLSLLGEELGSTWPDKVIIFSILEYEFEIEANELVIENEDTDDEVICQTYNLYQIF